MLVLSIWPIMSPYVLLPFGMVYGILVHIFHFLVCCTKKNLAALVSTEKNLFLIKKRR
jgi:hypothetical protein